MAYNPNVPATGHNGSQDYQAMQGNFAQIATSYNTDHIPLNSGSHIGDHQKVTFGINSVPSSPVSPPVMFTNIQDGAGQNQYIVGTDGSVLLPMGIILKWGAVNFTTNSKVITFTPAFPNNVFSITLNGQTNIPASNGALSYGNQTVSGFTAFQPLNSALTATYIAIGN
jgi:hypothetical protein